MYSGTHKIILLLIMTMLILGGCSSGGGSDSSTTSTTTSLSGVAQKGAFLKDSTVSLCKLDEELVCTDKKLEIKVSDDKGSYEFKTLPWSGLSRLSITGYYLDELTGEKSLSPATITAIIDIKSKVKQKSNTNLLTDLRAKRMKKLVDAGKSKEDADKESKEDVKQLFHVSSDDFSALNLTDFTQGKASVNVELLRLSAAVANAQDPVATLEELMKIYNEYGIEGVLNSTLYKTLMGLIKDVDVKAVVTKIAGTNEANALTVQDLSPFAIANIVTYGSVDTDSKVRITLIGTEFTDTPSISVSSTNNLLGIDAMHLADDNKSVVLDMNLSTSCQDINATFTVDYLGLKDVATPIRTTVLRYKNANEYCVTANNDGDNLGTITMPPKANISLVPMEDNKIRLSLAGTEFENYTGTIEAELITSSDTLTIDKAVVADDNKSVVFTLNGNTDYCTDNNVTIKLDASYLKNRDANLTSNKIRYVSPNVVASCGGNTNPIPISFNRAPTVSITPSALSEVPAGSTVELNATAEDINTEDSVTLLWKYKKVGSDTYIIAGTTDKFSHTFTSAGSYIVEVTATDNHDVNTTASIEFEVVAVNHAPTVSISPSGDKDIHVGDSVILKSLAADEDDDDLTISWKIQESTASTFTSVPLYGATGFKYTFDTIGTYLVVVEAEDGNGLKADANITVRVTQAPAATLTLPDINTSITVKGNDAFPDQGQSGVAATLETAPEHGSVEFYLVGNESPYIQYTSIDCFVGKDSFIYKSGDDYGRVNVTITSPSTLHPLSETKTLFNTEIISGEYLRAKSANEGVQITTATHGGSSSLTVVGNEIMNYNYDPDDTFVGNDFFEYKVSESIDECLYSKVGRIDFIVKAPLGKVHLFSWNDGIHGIELWRTDGTADGTVIVKDINPGSNYSNATPGVKIGNINYFSTDDGNHSVELWKTDGTESGTVMVKDINPGKDDGSFPYTIATIGDTMYFFAQSGDNNGSNHSGSTGLWKSDGTAAGTLLVQDFGNFSSTSYMQPGYLQAFGDKLIFSKDDSAGNGPDWEPWISDGSSSASKLKDIWPGDGGSDFRNCLVIGSKCYASADDYTHGDELWVTDGTESGTEMVKDIYEGGDSYGGGNGSVPTNLTIVGNKLFFIAFDTIKGISLWKSNGTTNGTVLVKDSFADENETNLMTRYDYRYNYGELTDVDGVLYFTLNDEIHGKEVWKSDGTETGTVMVKDIGSSDYSAPSKLTNLQGTLYFWYSDDNNDSNSGLWKSDGTENGTVLVKAFSADYDTGYEISGYGISVDDNKLYFELMDFGNNYTKEYWISDGTTAGTFKLVDGESMGEGPQ